MKSRPFVFWLGMGSFAFFSAAPLAHAGNSLTSESSAGSSTFSEGVSVTGDVDLPAGEDEEKSWNWKLAYNYSTSPPTAAANGTSVRSATSQFIGGVGYQSDWTADLDLNFSRTPSEALKSFGPTLSVGYTIDFASEDEFEPSVDLTLSLGTTSYQQDFTSDTLPTKRRKPRGSTTSEKIRQNSIRPQLTVSPISWLSASLSYTRYTYDRDVAEFLSFLNQPQSIRLGVGGFADTLDGFAEQSTDVSATLHLATDWDLEGSATWTRSKSSGALTHGWGTKLETRVWAPVSLALGVERNISPDQPAENLGTLMVSYRWK